MPIQLKDPHSHPIDGLIIDKNTVKAMVSAYRTKHKIDPKCLKFVHFNLMEVIQLFIDNEMINPSVPLTGANEKDYSILVLKIYLGTHLTEADSPPNPGSGTNPYIGMDTAIICNTQLNVLTKNLGRSVIREKQLHPLHLMLLTLVILLLL